MQCVQQPVQPTARNDSIIIQENNVFASGCTYSFGLPAGNPRLLRFSISRTLLCERRKSTVHRGSHYQLQSIRRARLYDRECSTSRCSCNPARWPLRSTIDVRPQSRFSIRAPETKLPCLCDTCVFSVASHRSAAVIRNSIDGSPILRKNSTRRLASKYGEPINVTCGSSDTALNRFSGRSCGFVIVISPLRYRDKPVDIPRIRCSKVSRSSRVQRRLARKT